MIIRTLKNLLLELFVIQCASCELDLFQNDLETNSKRDDSELLSIQTCCPPGLSLKQNGTNKYVCEEVHGSSNAWNPPIYKNSTTISNKTVDVKLAAFFPQCKNYLAHLRGRILETEQVIISGPIENSSLVWLSLNNTNFCVDPTENLEIEILVCEEAFNNELEKIKALLKEFIHDTIASNARTTGWISMVSAIFLGFTIFIYLMLWNEHNVHGWTQLSFLIALFLTYLVGGMRRLIGFEALHANCWAVIFEALEDFAAVSTSANLVALSFDLFFTLWRSLPTHSKCDGLRRFIITTTLAWSAGIVVMIAGIILKSSGQNDEVDVMDLTSLTKHLRRLLEFFLCIQNDMLLAICLPVVQISLFQLNLILFLASVIVLHRKQCHTELAFENIPKSRVRRFWIRRFSKLFLLMGLWWPLSVICVLDCIYMSKYTYSIWEEVLGTFYKRPDHVDYVIPWHVYLVANCLSVQVLAICLIFVWNRKTRVALKKRYPNIYMIFE